MSTFDTTASRFLRPSDVGRIRRNQKQVHFFRVLAIARSVVAIVVMVVAGLWAWRHTQSDARFSVRQVEVAGAKHVSMSAVRQITDRYVGANLFQMDIANVQAEFGRLGWVNRVEIEKRLPDTLRVRIVERVPVALRQGVNGLDYVDAAGVAFAPLSAAVGNPELPLITGATGADLPRCVAFLARIKQSDAALFSRLSEIRPMPPHGFAIFDRELGTVVYVSEENAIEKWRDLHAVAAAEQYRQNDLLYADLRFAGRLVVRPRTAVVARSAAAIIPAMSQEISN